MIIEEINKARISALKSGDKTEEKIYSYLLSVAQKVIKEGGAEDAIIAAFRKEETIMEGNKNYARTDEELTTIQHEIDVISSFLPQLMNSDQIRALVIETIEEVKPKSVKDKGKVMKVLMPKVKGKADGKLVNEIVMNYLF